MGIPWATQEWNSLCQESRKLPSLWTKFISNLTKASSKNKIKLSDFTAPTPDLWIRTGSTCRCHLLILVTEHSDTSKLAQKVPSPQATLDTLATTNSCLSTKTPLKTASARVKFKMFNQNYPLSANSTKTPKAWTTKSNEKMEPSKATAWSGSKEKNQKPSPSTTKPAKPRSTYISKSCS